jgi:PAS domain S-box-containing protein
MKKKITAFPKTELRLQAEATLEKKNQPQKAADAQRLVHELEVHQIELEMQNDELKRARAETETLLQQYTDLYDFAPVGYFTLTREGTIQRTNLAGANLLGVERGELLMRRFGFFVSNESRKTFNAFLYQTFASAHKATCEAELLNGGGDPLWAHLESVADKDHKTCFVVVADITERKRMEDALREGEERARRFIDTAREGFSEIDLNGRILSVNTHLEKMFGYASGEMLGLNVVEDLIFPDDCEAMLERLTHRRRGEAIYEQRFRRKDGQGLWLIVSASPINDRDGKVCGSFAMMTDITERKRAEDALKTAEANYRAIFEKAPIGIFQYTPDGHFSKINPALARMFGYASPQEMMAKITNIGHRIYVNPPDKQEFQHALAEGDGFYEFISKNYRKDATLIWTETVVRAEKDAQGNVLYYEGFIANITARKRAEAARTHEG